MSAAPSPLILPLRALVKRVAMPRKEPAPVATFLVIAGGDTKTIVCDIYQHNGKIIGTVAYQRGYFFENFDLRGQLQ